MSLEGNVKSFHNKYSIIGKDPSTRFPFGFSYFVNDQMKRGKLFNVFLVYKCILMSGKQNEKI